MASHDQHLVCLYSNTLPSNIDKRDRGTTFLVGPFLCPAIAGYIGDATTWRISFAVLTALYALSTFLVLAFGRETYYTGNPPSLLGSYFGIGNTKLPKLSTLGYWCKTLVVYVFKFPLLMTGMAILVTFTWPIGTSILTPPPS